MRRGTITLFLSLILTAALTLSLVTLESARVYSIRTQLTLAGDSAMDSLFAAYDGDLMEEFGLMAFCPDSLPEGRSPEEDFQYHLARELFPGEGGLLSGSLLFSGNLFRAKPTDVRLMSVTPLTDRGGEVFIRDAVDFMKYRVIKTTAEEVNEQLRLLREGEEAKESSENEQEPQTSESSDEAKKSGTEEEQEQFEEIKETSWLGKAERVRKNGWLDLIIPIEEVSSAYSTDKAGFPSEDYLTWARFFAPLGFVPLEEQLLFNEYLYDRFTCFTTVKSPEGMQYELEYVISGKKTDRKNLEGVVKELLVIREGLNLVTIYKTADLRQQTEALASTMAGWTGLAPVIALTQACIAAVWSFAESVVDVRTLLGGGKVPLIKSRDAWCTTLESIPELFDGNRRGAGNTKSGLKYEEYLRLMLYLEDMQSKAYRAMDVIQERIRLYRSGFSLDNCIYAAEVYLEAETPPLFFPAGEQSFRLVFSRMY